MKSLSTVPLTLYGCLICPYVQRVRITLNYLQIPYKYEEVDLLRSEQFSDWYKKINSLSKVPALVLEDGRVICESLVIVDFLNEVYGPSASRSLYPSDLVSKAGLKQWVSYVDGTLIPKLYSFNNAIKQGDVEKVKTHLKDFQESLKFLLQNSGFIARRAASKKELQEREVETEEEVTPSFYWGNELSLIDIALLPHINNTLLVFQEFLPEFQLLDPVNEEDQELFNAFREYYEGAITIPSFQAANYQVEQLPEVSRSQSLSNLNIDSPLQWNYRLYLSDFYVNRLQLIKVK